MGVKSPQVFQSITIYSTSLKFFKVYYTHIFLRRRSHLALTDLAASLVPELPCGSRRAIFRARRWPGFRPRRPSSPKPLILLSLGSRFPNKLSLIPLAYRQRLGLDLQHLLLARQDLDQLQGKLQRRSRRAAGDQVLVHYYPVFRKFCAGFHLGPAGRADRCPAALQDSGLDEHRRRCTDRRHILSGTIHLPCHF